ncbi:MAG: glycoside hydrolase family 5 protein [Phycisphaerae bacterium]
MKEMFHTRSTKCVIMCMLLCSIMPLYADIPWLHVDGNTIKDPEGNIVVLRGISLIDLGFLEDWEGGAINMIDRITDKNDSQGSTPGWYPKVIRIQITTIDSENEWPHRWDPDDDSLYNDLLRPVIDYCADKDLYAIVALDYITDTWRKFAQTSEFWRYMAPRFANDSHVLFDLFNEPVNLIGSDTENWLSVRTDMQAWVDIIRSYAPNNLILIGGPCWAMAIGPAATYPVSGNNIVYVCHLFPGHWLGGNVEWNRNHITTCAAVHPVMMTSWGFSQSLDDELLNGTISNFGRPLKDFLEQHGIGNTAWCASHSWTPMFLPDWALNCGEGEMGCFTKDWLYEKRNDDQPRGAVAPPTDWGHFSKEDFETNNLRKFPWEHDGDASWVTSSQEKHSGRYSAESGEIEDDQITILKVTLECVSGDISFYRKVSSESGFDYLNFSIDGVEKGKWSGEQDWTEVSFPVNEGTRTFEWTYSKDGSASDGDDTAWIDDITFPATGEMEPPKAPFKRGVNLTGWFQYVSSVQQIQFTKFTKQDLINIKSLGCDVIRLPIELHVMTNGAPDYTIDPLFYYFLDQIIDWAEELELHLILDNHSSDPAGNTRTNIGDILVPVWTQIAEHYKDRSTYIYYEVLNEPHGISDTTWNQIQQRVIDAIRAVDQKHTIIVGPAGYNSYKNLRFMPEYEDDNLIYTFHFYDPFVFTHQGAGWPTPSLEPLASVPFPYYAGDIPACPPELQNTWVGANLADYRNMGTAEHVRELIDIAVDFGRARNVPLFCGEFGVLMLNSNNEDRVYWYSHVRNYLEQKGIAWTMWDYKGGFGLFEQGTNELFDNDLNIPLVRAMGFTAPPQRLFVPAPEVSGFDLYLDNIAPNIIESSQTSNGLLDFYSEDNPASGDFCIHWTGVDLYNNISFRFSPIKDLSLLVGNGFAVDFWVRGNNPSARFDLRFIDTKTEDPGDHPWRMRYGIDRNIADWNGEWNHLQIPLNAFSEHGSWDNGWFNPIGAFDWTATERFEIVSEYGDLKGIHFYFDDIRVINPGPPSRPRPRSR